MDVSWFGLVRCIILLITVTIITSAINKGVQKCAVDRQLIWQTSTDSNVHLPECTPDGNFYRKEQCYGRLNYCWCVDQLDGQPIPGSVVRRSYPNCDIIPGISRGKKWRDDERCGKSYPIHGKPSECDAKSHRPCCSKWGWCGNTTEHCDCDGCVRFKKDNMITDLGIDRDAKWRRDGRCGSEKLLNGRAGECDPESEFPCCSQYGWCGESEEHCQCPDCVDYRIVKRLQSKKISTRKKTSFGTFRGFQRRSGP